MSSITVNNAQTRVSSLARSIIIAGLVIGVVGGIEFAAFFSVFEHMAPVGVYQYVASGLLGPSAFAGGYLTVLLGVVLHFAIAFVVAAVFLIAAARFRFLRRTVFISAPIYGALVNFTMSMIVLPYTALPKIPVTLPLILNGLIGDALFIGVPLAIIVWRDSRAAASNPRY